RLQRKKAFYVFFFCHNTMTTETTRPLVILWNLHLTNINDAAHVDNPTHRWWHVRNPAVVQSVLQQASMIYDEDDDEDDDDQGLAKAVEIKQGAYSSSVSSTTAATLSLNSSS